MPDKRPRARLRTSRRRFLGLTAAAFGAGAASALSSRSAAAHPTPLHDAPARVDPPGYDYSDRAGTAPSPHKTGTKPGRTDLPGTVYEPTPPADAPTDPGAYHRVDIDVSIIRHEYLPGVEAHTLAFNEQVPGPEIRLQEGEWVEARFTNRTELLHTIHWHGMFVPGNMDGVPYVTQKPTMPNQTFVYRFRALPYGTHFYHCHFGTPLHMQSAMHGALIVESDDDPIRRQFPYTREYTLLLNQIDSRMMEAELLAMVRRMKERVKLMKEDRITDRLLARFPDREAFLAAVRDGWIPPYAQARNGPPGLPRYNLFTMNGRCYPMTPKVMIKRDELIRIRLINVGSVEHYMHLHGHDFWEVARDGAPLAHAVRGNTLPVTPGRTHDIVLEGSNPGAWTFHDHAVTRATNNGLYPGGILTTLEYEDFTPEYAPKVALDE